ncbi:helix-turn-helix domain-containing protein [Candidatus Poriferisodalis sp.]|uniref:helix-turn-helix domain-containing protein n=1 Tax=Candidatus Poriferisodalis sp. TaxID=3101277 RepID=UPI003B016CA9
MIENTADVQPKAIPYRNLRSSSRIAHAVRDARMSSGLLMVEVAERTGVPCETVSAIENGRRDPRVGTLTAILRVLGYEIAFLPVARPAMPD